MSISREITIEFDGRNYTFTPSNKLLRKIDSQLYPQTIFGVLNQLDGQQAPLPALALIISELLNAGGGEFTEDDILHHLYDDIRENGGKGILPLAMAITDSLTLPADVPEGNGGGRQLAPAAKKSKSARRNIPA